MLRTAPLAFMLVATPALAATATDPAAVDRKVAAFTGAAIGTEGGARHPVDRRLKLAQCHQELALAWYGTRRDSVLVRCPDPDGWRIFVPVLAPRHEAAAPAAPIVARGEAVAILVLGHGFSLSRQGEALDQGAAGEWIRVRPADKKRADPVRAQVLRPGVVGMRLP